MSRNLNGTDQYLERTSAVLTAAPLTLACFFRRVGVSGVLMALSSSTGTNHFYLDMTGTGLGAGTIVTGGGGDEGSVSGTVNTGTWYHAAAVFASAASRTAYLNGVAGTTNTSSFTPSGINRTNVGIKFYSGSRANFLPGDVGEAGIWNVALTADEITSLSKGLSPLLVRPGSLVSYWPLVGRYSPEIDLRNGYDLTVTGATVADHPRIIMPRGRGRVVAGLGTPAATGQPAVKRFGGVPHMTTIGQQGVW